jgi:hypothetical protein
MPERKTGENGFRIRLNEHDMERMDRIREKWGCVSDAAAIRQALALASQFGPDDVILSPPKKKTK